MRRRSIVVLLALALLLVACGDDGRGPASSSSSASASGAAAPEDGWTWTDGSGETFELDEVPERIVAHSSAAVALMAFGIRPVGIYADTKVADDLALRDLDLDGIEIVGEEWGVINVEAVAALQPDLIVAEWWPVEEAYSGLEEGTGGASQRMEELAPIAGPAQRSSIVEMLEDYEELAASLGADVEAGEVAEDRARFEAARDRFEAALEAKPELTVLGISPTAESLYVAVPEHAAELSDFQSWGMELVVPDSPDDGFEYWETLSWENADKYQADLLLIDERGYPANLEEAKTLPGWQLLRAAAAEAVAVWPAYWLRSYEDYAGALDRLTAAIEAADQDLVP